MSDRHPKWVRVEPGTHIEAGTPWRVEYAHAEFRADGQDAVEHSGVGSDWVVPETDDVILVDSSWKPPLDLPTEPTWGLLLTKGSWYPQCGQWRRHGIYVGRNDESLGWEHDAILDFIPLTDEQVARIEAAR